LLVKRIRSFIKKKEKKKTKEGKKPNTI